MNSAGLCTRSVAFDPVTQRVGAELAVAPGASALCPPVTCGCVEEVGRGGNVGKCKGAVVLAVRERGGTGAAGPAGHLRG